MLNEGAVSRLAKAIPTTVPTCFTTEKLFRGVGGGAARNGAKEVDPGCR